jgi:hypothetical protein
MTWQPPVRGPEALAIYAAAEQDRATRPERYQFDADHIIERATKRGRLPVASFAPGWEQGLAAFLRAAQEEGRLNAVGIRMALQRAGYPRAPKSRTIVAIIPLP